MDFISFLSHFGYIAGAVAIGYVWGKYTTLNNAKQNQQDKSHPEEL